MTLSLSLATFRGPNSLCIILFGNTCTSATGGIMMNRRQYEVV